MLRHSSIIILLATATLISSCVQHKAQYTPRRTFQQCLSIEQCALSVQTAIEDNWSRPKEARNHLVVLLTLQLNENYSVTGVLVSKSSGVPEYDESAVKAVRFASPFVELAGLNKDELKKNFMKFQLVFDPEDLAR